jgi:hypothetical protein
MVWLRERWDRVLGAVLVALGAVLVFGAYYGMTDSRQLVEQLSYLISGGAGGLVSLGVGVTLLVNADRRAEFAWLDQVEAALRPDEAGPETEADGSAPGTVTNDVAEADLTVLLESNAAIGGTA